MTAEIRLAQCEDTQAIAKYDRHIPSERLEECIRAGRVYGLWDGGELVGVLRYSLFWQTIPFLDLLYLDEACRGKGLGRQAMAQWEQALGEAGHEYVMLSTQADEEAKFFYKKLGYTKIGAFLPPEQTAEEIMYLKRLK